MKRFILPLMILLFVGSLFAVESAPSEVVGYVKYECLPDLNFVALPMSQGYTMVGEFADDYPGNMDAVSSWDNVTQSWVTAVDWGYWEGDFEVGPGSVLMLNSLNAFTAYSIGDLPATNPAYGYIMDLNTIMVPLNRSDVTMAGMVGDEIGTLDAISSWNNVSQSWVTAVDWGYWEGDFDVAIGTPLMINSLGAGTWPNRAMTPTLKTSKK